MLFLRFIVPGKWNRLKKYQERVVDAEIDELLPSLPALALEGPKGVGKTETARRRARTVVELDDAVRAAPDREPALAAVADLEPTRHVYPATVWVVIGWVVVHLAVGLHPARHDEASDRRLHPDPEPVVRCCRPDGGDGELAALPFVQVAGLRDGLTLPGDLTDGVDLQLQEEVV